MGSSNSNLNKIEENKFNSIIYRVKLPTNLITAPEKDERFLYYYTIESMEKAKVFLNLGNTSLVNYFNIYNMNISFISLLPVLYLGLYRRFRIKKQNSRIKSFTKAFPFVVLYYLADIFIVAEFQQDYYFKFLKEDLFANESGDDINEYLNFKLVYNNLLQH